MSQPQPYWVGLLALSSLALVACADNKRDPSQFPISRAELVQDALNADDDPAALTYRRYCIGCHGSDGHGNGGTTGADLAAASGPLHTRSDAELIASVREGKAGKVASMPAHKPILNDAQIAAVVSYVRKEFGSTASPEQPE
ncbi:MAG: hypothetical protein JWN48_4209 [Myxococcaceae bacterium]|nr:hypothetical protein [Myxococcaceae bacterium]